MVNWQLVSVGSDQVLLGRGTIKRCCFVQSSAAVNVVARLKWTLTRLARKIQTETLPMPGYNKVANKSRRFEVIYIALTGLRAQEIIRDLGAGASAGQKGIENAYLQELAGIVDAALQDEVERRRA